jgi:hypothetical protein
VCVVEQFCSADGDSLVFVYTVYPKRHSEVVTVPEVGAGCAICVVREMSLVTVFVPNSFVCIIDITSLVRHFVLGSRFAVSPAGENCASIEVPKSVVNLRTGRIWQCQIKFPRAVTLACIENHEFIAVCAARALSVVIITALLSVIQHRGDESEAAIVIRDFFNCVRSRIRVEKCDCWELEMVMRGSLICETVLGQLDQMDVDFPSAGVVSRCHFFWWALQKKMEGRGPEKMEKVAVKIMGHQLQHNTMVTELDAWRAVDDPTSQWFHVIQHLIAEEIEMQSLPRVPGVPDAREGYGRIVSLEVRKDLEDFMSFTDGKRKQQGAPRKKALPEMLDFDEFSGSDSMIYETNVMHTGFLTFPVRACRALYPH